MYLRSNDRGRATILPVNWNTTVLFDDLSRRFPELSRAATDLPSPNPEDDLFVRHAIVGFGQSCSVDHWSLDHHAFISRRLEHDLSLDTLRDIFDDDANAVRLFSCLVLGCLLGKFQVGEIDDSGFMLGDAHLAGYILQDPDRLRRLVDSASSPKRPLTSACSGARAARVRL